MGTRTHTVFFSQMYIDELDELVTKIEQDWDHRRQYIADNEVFERGLARLSVLRSSVVLCREWAD